MHPYLDIPPRGLAVALLLLAAAWGVFWRRRAREPDRSDKEKQVWVMAALPAFAAVVLMMGFVKEITFPAYGLAYFFGCMAVTILGVRWVRQRDLLSVEDMLVLLVCAGVSGLVGARIVYVAQNWDTEFADRPPGMPIPGILKPLEAGDDLVIRTHTKNTVTVVFKGDETTLTQVKDRIEEQARKEDVALKLQVLSFRGPEGVVVKERGMLLRTRSRGPKAFVHVVGGKAAPKLGLEAGTKTQGVAIPLIATVDLRRGGQVYFGSVFGILLFSFIYLRIKKVGFLAMLDTMAPVLPLGLFFGRLGCVARGCCWGRECEPGAWFGIQFPQWSPPWIQFARERMPCDLDTQLAAEEMTPRMQELMGPLAEVTPALHPTQLYEGLIVGLVIFPVMLIYRNRFQRRIGQAFCLLVLLQVPVRFVVEHFRRDHSSFTELAGYAFTPSQLVSVLMLVAAVPAFVYFSRKGEIVPLPGQGPASEEAEEEASSREPAEA